MILLIHTYTNLYSDKQWFNKLFKLSSIILYIVIVTLYNIGSNSSGSGSGSSILL